MSVYRTDEERLIYQKCPDCKADIEIDVEECVFCDHDFRQDPAVNSEPVQDLESNASSVIIMFVTNFMISMIGVLGTQIEYPDGPDVSRQKMTISEKDQELFVKFLLKHDKTLPEEMRALIVLDEEAERVNPLTATILGKQGYTIPYTQDLSKKHKVDLLERIRIPQQKQ